MVSGSLSSTCVQQAHALYALLDSLSCQQHASSLEVQQQRDRDDAASDLCMLPTPPRHCHDSCTDAVYRAWIAMGPDDALPAVCIAKKSRLQSWRRHLQDIGILRQPSLHFTHRNSVYSTGSESCTNGADGSSAADIIQPHKWSQSGLKFAPAGTLRTAAAFAVKCATTRLLDVLADRANTAQQLCSSSARHTGSEYWRYAQSGQQQIRVTQTMEQQACLHHLTYSQAWRIAYKYVHVLQRQRLQRTQASRVRQEEQQQALRQRLTTLALQGDSAVWTSGLEESYHVSMRYDASICSVGREDESGSGSGGDHDTGT